MRKGTPLWGALLALVMVPALAAPEGETLYVQKCEACHGVHGKGGVGVPLSLPAFLQSVPDEYLVSTIRHGRPGRVMPAFSSLSDAQVGAIVKHIRSWAAGSPRVFPERPVTGDITKGRELFARHCAGCHGAQGEGGQGTGVTFSRPRDLPIIAPALRNPGFLAAASDQMIKTTLMQGREGTPMVSFLKQGLREEDINNVVAYVRSFEQQIEQERQQHPAKEKGEQETATLVYESPYSFDETVKNVEAAAVGANFRLIRTQPFEEGMVEPGKEDAKKKIIYFCNFGVLDKALAIDPRVGLFLPCRITVLERDGKVLLMSINPGMLSRHFNNARLDRLCDEMVSTYKSIMEEATL